MLWPSPTCFFALTNQVLTPEDNQDKRRGGGGMLGLLSGGTTKEEKSSLNCGNSTPAYLMQYKHESTMPEANVAEK